MISAVIFIIVIPVLVSALLIVPMYLQQARLARWSNLLSKVYSITSEMILASLQERVQKFGKDWDAYIRLLHVVSSKANLKTLTESDVEYLRQLANKLLEQEANREK